jgi:hypothetical protein
MALPVPGSTTGGLASAADAGAAFGAACADADAVPWRRRDTG